MMKVPRSFLPAFLFSVCLLLVSSPLSYTVETTEQMKLIARLQVVFNQLETSINERQTLIQELKIELANSQGALTEFRQASQTLYTNLNIIVSSQTNELQRLKEEITRLESELVQLKTDRDEISNLLEKADRSLISLRNTSKRTKLIWGTSGVGVGILIGVLVSLLGR